MSTITSRILHAPANHNMATRSSTWIWPLPRLDGVEPKVLSSADEESQRVEIGYPSRSFAPGLVPVFAAQDGIITYAASKGADGPTICIDHLGGWSTQYASLAHLLARPTDRFRRRRKERVRAGDVIGHAQPTLRLRFALARLTDDGCIAVDPLTNLHAASALPWFTDAPHALGRRAERGGYHASSP